MERVGGGSRYKAVSSSEYTQKKKEEKNTHSLDISAILGQGKHAVVGNVLAARDVEALQTLAVGCNGINGALGNVLVVGNVESQQ